LYWYFVSVFLYRWDLHAYVAGWAVFISKYLFSLISSLYMPQQAKLMDRLHINQHLQIRRAVL